MLKNRHAPTVSLLAATLIVVSGGTAAAADSQWSQAPSQAADELGQMDPQAVRNEIRDAMRSEALAKDDDARLVATRRLTRMFQEVKRNTAIAKDERIRLHALVWSRLTKIKKREEAKMAYAQRNPRQAAEQAQRETAERQFVALAASQYELAGGATVGPSQALHAVSARGGAGAGDRGEELVDLITKTIAPDTWDINGGPGSIVYYQNLQVLVVRQMGEVHGDVAGLLDGLRRAGP